MCLSLSLLLSTFVPQYVSMCVEPHSVYMFVYDLKVPGFTSQIDLVPHKVKHIEITLSLKSEFCL